MNAIALSNGVVLTQNEIWLFRVTEITSIMQYVLVTAKAQNRDKLIAKHNVRDITALTDNAFCLTHLSSVTHCTVMQNGAPV